MRTIGSQLGRIAGLIATCVVQVAWLAQPIPLVLKILQLALVAMAIVRPAYALLAMAGLGPLTTALAILTTAPVAGARILEQMVLAVITGALVRWRPDGPRSRLAGVAALLGAAAAASAVAVLPAHLLALQPDATARDHLAALWRGDYFARSPSWEPLFFAVLAIEGAALAWAVEVTARQHAGLVRRAVVLALAGHTAAASLTVERIVAASVRGGEFPSSLPRFFERVRYSMHYDHSASASVFVMMITTGVALLAGGWVSRLAWTGALLLIGMALWLTGSRMALLTLPVVLIGTLIARGLRSARPRQRRRVAIAVGLIVTVGIAGAMIYPPGRNQSLEATLLGRGILARTALNMVRTAPAFGIGIGTFYDQSPRFGSQELLKHPDRLQGFTRANENAHNNFLQVLAEQGIIGLAALLGMLAVIVIPAIRMEVREHDRMRLWLLAGVSGFVLTWLTGHPLLVQESAFTFWMFCGLLASLTPPPVPSRILGVLALIGAALLVASAPFRSGHALAVADLEYRGVGVSLWREAEDGTRYREAGGTFSLYLQSDSVVAIPVRRAPNTPDPLRMEIRLDDRMINAVLLVGDNWQTLRLRLPAGDRRFTPVEFVVTAADGSAVPEPAVHVGKEATQ